MKRILILLIVFSVQFTHGQQQDLQRANLLFGKTYYSAAIPLYEKISIKIQTKEVIQNLGDCYFYTNDYDKAQAQYASLISNKELNEDFYFRYAQTLKARGKYTEANDVLRNFYLVSNNTVAIEKLDRDIKNLKNVTAIGERFEIHNLALNTINSEFGGVVFGDNLVFSAVKKKPNLFDKTYKWNNESYLNLVSIALKNVIQNDSITAYFSKDLKSSMHESNAIFTKDGKTMYFTRNNSNNGRRGKNTDKISNIQIFRAEFVKNKWTNIVALPFNNPNYSVEHPALSPDEKTLYFASDMPGTFGSLDIYKVSIDGITYGTPINLGDKINTSKRDQFPFVSKDNKLYFSSNGHEGYGGLDIFVSDINDNSYSKAANVGIPVNSGYDDFAYYIDSDIKEGYFSSDRPGGKGKDDIYSLKETKELLIEDCKQYIAGIITDVDSHLALENAIVILKNASNQELEKAITKTDGKFSFTIECESDYSLFATKENYTENSKSFHISGERNKTNDGSMEIRSIEIIKKEEQAAIDKKLAADLLVAQQLKATELAALEQKKKDDAIAFQQKKRDDANALEAKRLADKEAAEQLKKDKLAADKKNAAIAEAKKKEKAAAIVAAEKDVIKDKDRLIIKTEPIYFDYDLWYIRKDSKKILNRVVELMNKYPEMVVEIGSHTDNRGNTKYNADLSQNRADATRNYILEQGIPKNRILAKGYGESVPIIKCIPEDSCDEEQHELNRRSEFVIKNL
ncbi:OmpA family protein [Flavobacterium granuli]|uniref:Outer membrane protein OmpA-like peptidoglycan-associated protein n=1 Tax=Flavobacterium granuli TaxID=280093 RepID=A0ABU1RZT4_9FLAO|nr:OmpA family protein [Flavobacterium granuli]MDR6844271.1 outer membrane protein OmpA-like peptidoglycan-associated protein [Flavobacterium granuli]